MKKIQFYQLLVIFLIVLNGITVTFLYLKKPKHHHKPDPMEIVDLLHLNGAKTKKVLSLQKDHFDQKDQLIKNRKELHLALFNTFYNSSCKQSTIDTLINKIVENEREIETMTYFYFMRINDLCDAEQKKNLKKLIRRVLTHQHLPPPER
jgi:hypothetical protein